MPFKTVCVPAIFTGACTTPGVFHKYSSSDILMSSEAVFIIEFDMVCDASEVRSGGVRTYGVSLCKRC